VEREEEEEKEMQTGASAGLLVTKYEKIKRRTGYGDPRVS